MFRRTETINFKEFMSGEFKEKEPNKLNKKAIATGTLIPLAFVPKAFAATPDPCVTAASVLNNNAVVPVGVGDAVGKEIISAMAHLFDPIVDIIIAISFPVASVMILWKLFMSFFKDSGDTWEGIGKICITYCIVQMFPIFVKVLKGLGTLAVGI